MIVCDTSALFAELNDRDPSHGVVSEAFDSEQGPFLVSPVVVAELDYLVTDRVDVGAELAMLKDIAEGTYRLEPFDAGDVSAARGLIDQYRDLGIGLTDASIVVLAARHRTTRILTLDQRSFRAITPLHGRAFELLP